MPRLALALILTSLTVAAGAQDAGAPGGRGGMMRSLPVVTALDADGSGDISADEIRNAPANLRSLDADRSGALERSEALTVAAKDGSEEPYDAAVEAHPPYLAPAVLFVPAPSDWPRGAGGVPTASILAQCGAAASSPARPAGPESVRRM